MNVVSRCNNERAFVCTDSISAYTASMAMNKVVSLDNIYRSLVEVHMQHANPVVGEITGLHYGSKLSRRPPVSSVWGLSLFQP